MAFLRVVSGPQSGREYALSDEEATIGRHPACQIIIEVGAVSRQHARIKKEKLNSQYWIEDLHSRNGTLVNDHLIAERTRLKPGDIVKICDVALSFIDDFDVGDESSSKLLRRRSNRNILIDDGETSGNTTIMSKVEVSSNYQRAQLTATPEAKLQALMEITQALSRVLTLEDVFPRVLDSLFMIFMQADRGFIVELTSDGELVPTWSKTRNEGSEETIRISRGIVNHVLSTKTAILSKDATADQRFEPSQSVANLRIRSFMCAPLMDGEGNLLGVIQLDTLDPANSFKEDDLEVLATVALQVGIAIDNAKMHQTAIEQSEIERDLELATDVQHGFLPLHPPEVKGYDFYDYYQPANHVGGDFYDYITLPEDRIAIVVADVVGHGVAAALLMAKLSAETRFCLATEPDLASAVNRLNRSLVDLQLDRFVTMAIGLLNPLTHQLQLVNAGHLSPFRRNRKGKVEDLGKEISGLPLGILEDSTYEEFETKLEPGDLIVFMTDGVFECENEGYQQLGVDRIKSVLKQCKSNANGAGEKLMEAVRGHLGKHDPADDMCLVCLHRNQ